MIVAFAGRRIDPADALIPRFPSRNEANVRHAITTQLLHHRVSVLVSSGACGADIIAQEAARALGIRTTMILPFDPASFRQISVADRPGNWAPRFDALVRELAAVLDSLIILSESHSPAVLQSVLRHTNAAILDHAQSLAARQTACVAMTAWNGASRGADDLIDDFRERAVARDMMLVDVKTL